MQPVTIQPMQEADLDFAAECTRREGWISETREAFETFWSRDPRGCFIARRGVTPLGICIATSYGSCGFIGELIVVDAARGEGIGSCLLAQGVEYLQRSGARTIYLDGVVSAVPLYERHGFQKVCRSLRFSGTLVGQIAHNVRRMNAADLQAVSQLDQQAFGADRSFFLRRRFELHPQLAWVLEQNKEMAGFVLARQVNDWIAVGPLVVVHGSERPQGLLEAIAAAAPGIRMGLGVLETHPEAVSLLRKLGFDEAESPPWRMALGLAGDLGISPLCWANGSPAKG